MGCSRIFIDINFRIIYDDNINGDSSSEGKKKIQTQIFPFQVKTLRKAKKESLFK